MAKFKIGQRVRIKWSYTWPELNGTAGTIVDIFPIDIEEAQQYTPPISPGTLIHVLYCDKWGGVVHADNSQFAPVADQLEPIVDLDAKARSYDGNKVISWEDMQGLWQPPKIETPTEA